MEISGIRSIGNFKIRLIGLSQNLQTRCRVCKERDKYYNYVSKESTVIVWYTHLSLCGKD